MRKVVVAVFAHPDDEAFGPGGTLAHLAFTNDVYLITATGGEAGKNSLSSTSNSLAMIRKNELLASSKILGVKKVFFLGFEDGTLSNNNYHKVASKLEDLLKKLKPSIIITFEPHGVSGHIDHIAISFITTFVTEKLPFVKELWYYCLLEKFRKSPANYFIHFPKGYKEHEIDITIDTSCVWKLKKEAMLAHKSQSHDALRILKSQEKQPRREYFITYKS